MTSGDGELDTSGRETMTDMINKKDKHTIKTTSGNFEHDTRGVAHILPRVLAGN